MGGDMKKAMFLKPLTRKELRDALMQLRVAHYQTETSTKILARVIDDMSRRPDREAGKK
jgi:hypothetical protein